MRKYFLIKIPNENAEHSLNVCIGNPSTQIYIENGSYLFVKTNETLIENEKRKGITHNKIFPPGLTTEYTFSGISEILRLESLKTPMPE